MKLPRKPARPLKPAGPPADDDVALFRDAVGEVARIESTLAERRKPRPPPLPLQSRADDRAVLSELLAGPPHEIEDGELLSYVRAGASKRILKRIGKGEFSVRDEIDLHQMTAAVAARSIAVFLDQCQRAGRLCVRIVHGKGLNSRDGPVLKRLTDRMLRHRGDVLAFRSARASDGGSGAVIVLLRGER